MEVTDQTVVTEGTIRDLIDVIEDKVSADVPVNFKILCFEYGRQSRRINDVIEKGFSLQCDCENIMPFLFDLDIQGWNFTRATIFDSSVFDRKWRTITICLERVV